MFLHVQYYVFALKYYEKLACFSLVPSEVLEKFVYPDLQVSWVLENLTSRAILDLLVNRCTVLIFGV